MEEGDNQTQLLEAQEKQAQHTEVVLLEYYNQSFGAYKTKKKHSDGREGCQRTGHRARGP